MKIRVLGITGGIASGKSSVLALLSKAGIATASSDALAHKAIEKGQPAYRKIVKRYGPAVLGRRRQLDRAPLGKIVFSSPRERRWLERQIHPFVVNGLIAFTRTQRQPVALDIPLLFEARLRRLVDRVVVVSCTRAQQFARLRRRSGLSRAEALLRMRAQMPLSEKVRRADFVLHNTGTKAKLAREVKELLRKLDLGNSA